MSLKLCFTIINQPTFLKFASFIAIHEHTARFLVTTGRFCQKKIFIIQRIILVVHFPTKSRFTCW